MTKHDTLISEWPTGCSGDDYEDIKTALADMYSQPRIPRITGSHGFSEPLPDTRAPQPPLTAQELERVLAHFDRLAIGQILVPAAMIALFFLIR